MRLSVIHRAAIAGGCWGAVNILFSLAPLLAGGENQRMSIYHMLCPVLEPSLDYVGGIPWLLIGICIAPLLVMGDIRQSIQHNAPYRFTRQKGRVSWYARRSLCAMAAGVSFALAYALMAALCSIAWGTEGGGSLAQRQYLQMCGLYVACMAPFMALAALAAWVASMRLGARVSAVVSMAVVLLLLFAGISMAETSSPFAIWGFRINPVCSAIPSWRDAGSFGLMPAKAAKGHDLLTGAWIQFIEIALVELAGLRMVNKMDIVSEPQEG